MQRQQSDLGPEFRDFQRLNREVKGHHCTYVDWLGRHEEVCRKAGQFGPLGLKEVLPHLYQRLRDERNLINAIDFIVENGGRSPGPAGETLDNMPNKFDLSHQLRDVIDRGDYLPRPNRVITIPKSSGRGVRQIHIPGICDRVVYRGILQVVSPLLDTMFAPTSFGGRPHKDRRHALAHAEFFTMQRNKSVWLTVDIADAFVHVPRKRLLNVLRSQLPIKAEHEKKRAPHNRPICESLHGLIEKVVMTHSCPGLPQGMSTSPLFFNAYADHFFDRPWRRLHPQLPALRFVDDINVLCETLEVADLAARQLEQLLLPAGFSLKPAKAGESLIANLRNGAECVWLGYAITLQESGLVVRMSERGWGRIHEKLADVLPLEESAPRVGLVVLGIIAQLGPTFPHLDHRAVYDRIADTSAFIRIAMPNFTEFVDAWEGAFRAWEEVRSSVWSSLT